MTYAVFLIVASAIVPLWQTLREKPMAQAWALAYALAVVAFLLTPAVQLPAWLLHR